MLCIVDYFVDFFQRVRHSSLFVQAPIRNVFQKVLSTSKVSKCDIILQLKVLTFEELPGGVPPCFVTECVCVLVPSQTCFPIRRGSYL